MGQKVEFSKALGTSSQSFLVYVLSLMAALAINAAVSDYFLKHESWWGRWIYAASITVLALSVITIIVVFSDMTDDTVSRLREHSGSERSKAQPRMGKFA